MLEFINLTTISIALMIIGAIGVVLLKKPLDKVRSNINKTNIEKYGKSIYNNC